MARVEGMDPRDDCGNRRGLARALGCRGRETWQLFTAASPQKGKEIRAGKQQIQKSIQQPPLSMVKFHVLSPVTFDTFFSP